MIPGSANALLLGSAAGGYGISLRFNSADSAYLSRTPASAGNRKTWTWAGWVKRGDLANRGAFFAACNAGATVYTIGEFDAAGHIRVLDSGVITGLDRGARTTTALFRDPAAWYHIVLVYDTPNATDADRIRIYVNGSRITTFSEERSVTQNLDSQVNLNTQLHSISRYGAAAARYHDGYLADIHFIDGQALDPTSFGEFDDNGIWQPIEYTGTYGTNGFKLDFSDNSAATAAALGADSSGNGNNWTPNNLSVTAGAGNDSLVDVPTNGSETDTGVGGEVRGNYATFNPLDNGGLTLSNGNLTASRSTSSWVTGRHTIGMSSGKWYWEVSVTTGTGVMLGILNSAGSLTTYLGGNSGGYGYNDDGLKYSGGASGSYGASYTTGDIIGIAFDADSGSLTFYKNGVSQGVAYSSIPAGTYFPATSLIFSPAVNINHGQRPFAYTAPSGFKALCTANLPAPTIEDGSTAMDVALWTGNGSARSITGLGFNPDLVWIKGRSGATDHALYDSVRGATLDLVSNSTAAETTQTQGLTAFNSDGFSLGTLAKVNTNSATYAGWAFDAGSSTVTNTDGTITSQVRANPSAGFSIVGFTVPGSGNFTVGHGLGVAPSLIIVKGRGASDNWVVFHSSVCTGVDKYLRLNTTAALITGSVWGTALPTSTVFGGTAGALLVASQNAIAYCFAPVAGYSAFGKYTGNGSADGSFVYLGFRPAVVLVKMSSSTGNWTMLDYKREGYNVDNDPLYPNLSNAEGTTDLIDITSNGFKVRTTDASVNTNAGTYIYAAWAESPFALARAR